jgi:hypothetical protein
LIRGVILILILEDVIKNFFHWSFLLMNNYLVG